MAKRAYHHGDLRSAMLAASELILDRDGLDALTLRAAARAAGVSHTAPVHHFGDLSGLLSALAASGFSRFRQHLLAAASSAGGGDGAQLAALCLAYVDFARASPGLFQLMFRSSRLDWSRSELVAAAEAAFGLLTHGLDDGDGGLARDPLGPDRFATVLTRWSTAHGLAMLSLDGRLDALAVKERADPAAAVVAVARNLSHWS